MNRLEAFYRKLDMQVKRNLYKKSPDMARPWEIYFSLNDIQKDFLIRMTALKKKQGTFNKRWLMGSLTEFHEANFVDYYMQMHQMTHDSNNDVLV